MSAVAALGTIVAVPSIALVIYRGFWGVAVFDIIAFAWLLGLWRATGLPYRVRVINLLALMFAIGIAMMVTVGPISQVFLLVPPILGAILLGPWPAALALASGGAAILTLRLTGHRRPAPAPRATDPA